MSKSNLITVIIPVYKVEPYLRQCLDSIVGQTYTNIEVIIVDDGSPDKCPAICDEYAAKDSRIKVIHQPNQGLSAARNAALDVAEGEYITCIDSDDYVATTYIEDLYNALNGADISVCDGVQFIDGINPQDSHNGDKKVVLSGRDACLEMFELNYLRYPMSAWGKLIPLSYYDDIRFPCGKIHEDEFTTHRLFYKADRIAFLTKDLYFYRQRGDSIIGVGKSLSGTRCVLEAYDDKISFFNSNNEPLLSDWAIYYKYFTAFLALHTIKDKEFKKEMKLLLASMNEQISQLQLGSKKRLSLLLCKYFPAIRIAIARIKNS